jgi:hypothetical protein
MLPSSAMQAGAHRSLSHQRPGKALSVMRKYAPLSRQ